MTVTLQELSFTFPLFVTSNPVSHYKEHSLSILLAFLPILKLVSCNCAWPCCPYLLLQKAIATFHFLSVCFSPCLWCCYLLLVVSLLLILLTIFQVVSYLKCWCSLHLFHVTSNDFYEDLVNVFTQVIGWYSIFLQFTGQKGKGVAIYLTLLYYFDLIHRHLHIKRVIVAESSHLHITSSRTRAGKLRFLSASR